MEALRESEEKYKIQLQSKEGVIASLKEQFDKVAVEPHETPTSQIYQVCFSSEVKRPIFSYDYSKDFSSLIL